MAFPVAAGVADCPMLRILLGQGQRDGGFALTNWLILDEMALMHATCRTWRSWIERCDLRRARYRELSPRLLPLLADCQWARPYISTAIVRRSAFEPEPDADGHWQLLHDSLSALAQLPRLCELELRTGASHIGHALLRGTFDSLHSTLSLLRLHLLHTDSLNLLQGIMTHIRPLGVLHTLHVTVQSSVPLDTLDLSALPHLPKLQIFHFWRPGGRDFRATAEQVRQLAQCTTFTSLEFGRWSPDEGYSERWAQRMIDEGLAALLPQPAAPGEEGPSLLQVLSLASTILTPQLWPYLTRMPKWITIWPKHWRHGMTSAQWNELGTLFPNLVSLAICPDEHDANFDALIRASDFLPPLLRIGARMDELRMGNGIRFSTAQLESIVQGLPVLRRLVLDGTFLESVEPLARARSLEKMMLIWCRNLDKVAQQFRVLLPALPFLTHLTLEDV